MMKFVLLILPGIFFFFIESNNQQYDLRVPAQRIVLPPVLHEISGITPVDSVTAACVQDENGIVFFLNLRNGNIRRELPFWYNGDYEGVARVGKTMYVLRSDGVLYEIADYSADESDTRIYETHVPALNNEGLCHDPAGERLLIGCKGRIAKGPEHADARFIYAFDLKTKTLAKDPVFEFSIAELTDYAVSHGIIPATRVNKKGRAVPSKIRLNTSAIALHPSSEELFLLSATDHVMIVVDLKGKIKRMAKLDPATFNKPEGITFLENGDMLITNEGQHGSPTLLRFNHSGK
jgi:uncharacterized protein YjiK